MQSSPWERLPQLDCFSSQNEQVSFACLLLTCVGVLTYELCHLQVLYFTATQTGLSTRTSDTVTTPTIVAVNYVTLYHGMRYRASIRCMIVIFSMHSPLQEEAEIVKQTARCEVQSKKKNIRSFIVERASNVRYERHVAQLIKHRYKSSTWPILSPLCRVRKPPAPT